jgi:hypothetical protein
MRERIAFPMSTVENRPFHSLENPLLAWTRSLLGSITFAVTCGPFQGGTI